MISDGGCKNVKAGRKLGCPVNTISHHFPVYQVFTMKNRDTGKVFESTVNKIIVFS